MKFTLFNINIYCSFAINNRKSAKWNLELIYVDFLLYLCGL